MNPKFRNLSLFLGTSLVITSAHAADFTYTVPDAFTTGTDNWTTDVKWNAVPISDPTTSLIFTLQATGNSQTQTTDSVNNITTINPNNAFQLNTMTFNSGPSAGSGSLVVALNISGNPLDFVSNGTTTPVINLNGNRSAGQAVNFNVLSNMTLGSGTLFTGNGTATYNFSGQLSGSAFTKSGTSTLTLSGTNTYSGNATLSAGGLILANSSALSAGQLNITGNSTIGLTSGVNISNTINRGTSTVTYFYSGTAAGTATYSGALTGSGTINIGNSGSGNNTTILDFTNAGGFTGNVVGAAGNANGADYFRFSAIGDGGNFTFNKSGNRGGVIYNGTSAIEFDTRQIALGTSFGGGGTYGVNGNGVVQNAFQNVASDAAHTVTFNTDMVVGAIGSSSIFYFDGSNTGNNTFAGDIADATGTNTLGIGKQGSGKWILSGNNSYEGNTFILNGTLSVNTIDVVANSQALGKGSLIYFSNGSTTTSTLEFTGSTNSITDKQIVIGSNNNGHNGGAAIVNNGTGTMSFSNATFNALPGTVTTIDRTLTLGGSNSGANVISGTIQDNVTGAAQVLVSKTGAGTWVLSGANTYTGGTTVSQGTLVFRNTGAKSATGTHAFAAGTTLGLGVGGAGFFSSTDITNAFAGGTLTGNLSGITVTTTTNVGIDTTAGNFTHSTDITGTSKGLTKLGANSLTLEGANTYTGATTVREGTLIVNGSLGNTAVTVDGGAFGGTGSIGSILTITSGSFHVANINDALLVTGAVTLYAGFGVDDLTGITWGSVADGTYTLIDGTLGAGVFAGLANNSLLTAYDIGGGRSAYFQEGSLQLVVIPEPRALLLGSLGILLLLRRRR